jgi:hypothetical protein
MSSDPNRPPGQPGGPGFNSQFANMNIGAQPFVPNVQAQPFVPYGAPMQQQGGYGYHGMQGKRGAVVVRRVGCKIAYMHHIKLSRFDTAVNLERCTSKPK